MLHASSPRQEMRLFPRVAIIYFAVSLPITAIPMSQFPIRDTANTVWMPHLYPFPLPQSSPRQEIMVGILKWIEMTLRGPLQHRGFSECLRRRFHLSPLTSPVSECACFESQGQVIPKRRGRQIHLTTWEIYCSRPLQGAEHAPRQLDSLAWWQSHPRRLPVGGRRLDQAPLGRLRRIGLK